MNQDDLKEELFNLTAYMITSARGLYDEPADYGIFRLLDSSGRLLAIMESLGFMDAFLTSLKQAVDEEREGSMDGERQGERLDQLVMGLAEEMQKRLSSR